MLEILLLHVCHWSSGQFPVFDTELLRVTGSNLPFCLLQLSMTVACPLARLALHTASRCSVPWKSVRFAMASLPLLPSQSSVTVSPFFVFPVLSASVQRFQPRTASSWIDSSLFSRETILKGCHLCKEVQFFQSDGLLQSYKNGRLRYFSQLSEREGTESNGPVRFIPKHLRANPKVKVTKIPELKENTRGKAESKKLKSEPRNVGAVEDEPTETTNDILIERRVEGNNANFAADLDTEEQFSDSEEASTVIRNEERRQNRDLKKTAFTRVSNSESEREYLQNVTDRIEAGKQTSSSISISNSMKKKPVFTYGDGTVMDFSSKLPGGMTLGELLKVSNNEEEDHEEKENNLEEQELVVEAKTIAYNLLAKRSMTVSVLKEKLEKKMIQEHIIKVVVQELKKSGFLNDMAYAIDYARVRFQGSSWGPSRIRHELKKRGVSSNDIKLAISEVFKEENTNEDNTKGDEIENFDAPKELSVTAWEQLKIAASRQWSRGSQTNKEGKKRRMVGWLQRRGYSWSLVSRILAELEGENKD